ncbi:MAG: hypothetical protein K6F33_09655 [Bacteroidales bacterium]|nr:hypothetical protein [Bacteroidales bacterium]
MVKVLNPTYDTVFKHLMQNEEVVKALLEIMFDYRLCVKVISQRANSYINTNNSRVYYLPVDAVILDGPQKLETINFEVYRVVKENFEVLFIIEFMALAGRYRSYVEVKEMQEAKSHLEKVLTIFSGGGCKTNDKVIDIDEDFDDSSTYKTIIDALVKISADDSIRQELVNESISDN